MDRRFSADHEWSAISSRMKPGDEIYPYDISIRHEARPDLFSGIDGGAGYIVLRGWCLVGRLQTRVVIY